MRVAILLSALLTARLVLAAEPDFDHTIVPILRQHCAECHAGDQKKGGFSMNTRPDLLKGGENGPTVVPGKSAESKILKLIALTDDEERMPPGPKRPPVSPEQAAALKAWIDAGAPWTEGFAFKRPAYEPPLKPRRVTPPAAQNGREHPVDRILDTYLAQHQLKPGAQIDDARFLRRVTLDLTGLLPTPEELAAFRADAAPDKRAKKIRALLQDEIGYTEHWLSFWNDLLRNDYAGTGYIDGGRRQISAWLYRSLQQNKPYDQFARELIAPTAESEGFAKGIKWRGVVSAGQSVPVQFAQSVGQTFLGINLKCASCHDSFIDRWTLEEAYGLAAIYSPEPLEQYRCDKPTGKPAKAAWLFPELGTIDSTKPPAERLKQLAALMTHPENGRFTRTMVNRLWHRLMGRGIVHPVDAMQSEPWNADLLDFLASDLAENKYDLKRTLELICTSQAYQSECEVLKEGLDEKAYVYNGPRAKRMTAEQFTDAVWQLTGTAPGKFDAPVARKRSLSGTGDLVPGAKWIWRNDGSTPTPANEALAFKKTVTLNELPQRAGAAVSADNGFVLYVNGQRAAEGENWEQPVPVQLDSLLKKGENEIVVVARNGGGEPNPAGMIFEAVFKLKETLTTVRSDETWQVSRTVPDAKGKFPKGKQEWAPAVPLKNHTIWNNANEGLRAALNDGFASSRPMVRAALMKSDLLMRTLGRPNREQIVSMRPNDLSTLEAMDLNNGEILNNRLAQGAQRLLKQGLTPEALIRSVYVQALTREPSPAELAAAQELLGQAPTAASVQDLLWAVLMLPEFQIVR